MTEHSIAGGGYVARIAAFGAELRGLRSPGGTELIWQAGPAWPKSSPILFPVVGTLRGDAYRHEGRTYRLGRHGFIRDCGFDWVERGDTTARLVFTDNPATRAVYPFAFRFEVDYAIGAEGLRVDYTIHNPGSVPLPASMGAHPAFNWPQRAGVAKTAHWLRFGADEPTPIRRVDADGLVRADAVASPVVGRELALHEGLFADNAIIIDQLASRAVRYGAPETETIEVSWEGLPVLGIWMRPGADFLCIEPWHGLADPAGFEGEIGDKPWGLTIPPGESRRATHRIRVVAD